jgi:hypothetical protein
LTDSFANTDSPTEPPAPYSPPPPPADAGGKPNRLVPVIIVGVIVGFLAIVLFLVKDNASAADLKVGDCFDVPTSTSVSTVTHHPCTEPHGAEVIHVAEYSGSMTIPITFTLDGFVETACVPVFKTYVGDDLDNVSDLTISYFYPSNDGWSSGDRTITCYVSPTDESQMTESVKGSRPS